MGYDVEGRQIFFRLSKHNSPQDAADEQAMEDVQAAVGALLTDPVHADLVAMEGGFVEAYRAVMKDPVARGRVAYLLIQALARVRKGNGS